MNPEQADYDAKKETSSEIKKELSEKEGSQVDAKN